MSNQNLIVLENKIKTNKLISMILVCFTLLVHLALFILTKLEVFSINFVFIVMAGLITFTASLVANIFARKEKYIDIVAYINILIATLITGILGSNENINLVLTFVFPLVIASLYLEKKFMIYSYIVVSVNILITVFIKVKSLFPETYMDEMMSYEAAYVLELAVMIFVFSLLNKRVVGLFENLLDSKEQEKLFAQIKYAQDQSASLSHQLYESLIILDESIESSAIANEAIFENATEAERGSLESKNYVIESNQTIARISDSLKEIADITHKMIEAFKSSYDKTSTSLKGINHTKTTMEKVGQASHQTMVVMDDLKVTSQDINQIIEEISGIAEQTNLLALNASIEAARAGEMGKGFAVVAEEVRKLSVESSGSAEKIRGLIQALNKKTEGAIHAVNLSSQLIDEGIEDVNVTQDMVQEVMKLQEDTNQYMEKIEGFSQSSYTYGESLNEVMIKIKDQVTSSSHQVSEIAKETKIQTQAMEEIASSVKTVEQVSEALKTIR